MMQAQSEQMTKNKLQLARQNLDRVLDLNGQEHAVHFLCYGVKLPYLKLKTQPNQL
jgi:hypothetical protein